MNITPSVADAAVYGQTVTRIVVGAETIEFLDQSFIIAYDTQTRVGATNLTTDAAFLLAKLADVWNLSVEVPTEVPSPNLGVEALPRIVWPTEAGQPPTVEPYDGPTISVKIGDAIRALIVLADMTRAGTVPDPTEP